MVSAADRARGNARRWVRAAVLTLVGLVAAWSWLFLVSRWGPGTRIDILTFKAGFSSKITRTLIRQARGTGHHSHAAPGITAIYATPEYFTITEQMEDAARYQPDRFAVFYMFEDIHVGELSEAPPSVILRRDDGTQWHPVDRAVLRNSFHHRASVVRFPGTDADGRPTLDERATSFELVAHDEASHGEQTMQWNLPITYQKDDLESQAGLSLTTLLPLLAGLLAVLSPCLLQLTVYYTTALAGLSMQQGSLPAEARRRVVSTALYFIAGFTIVFTLAGSLAGLAGETLQSSGLMEAWNRPLAMAAGVGILILGVWVGASSGAPGLCRLPRFAALGASSRWLAAGKAMFLGSAFAVGCSTCFGGALFISLMIYVGAVGSASLGAVTLLLFSLGMAVPYLLAAVFLSRALPLVGSVERAASGVGLVCSLVLTFFGAILITDSFHVPSDVLYRLYLAF